MFVWVSPYRSFRGTTPEIEKTTPWCGSWARSVKEVMESLSSDSPRRRCDVEDADVYLGQFGTVSSRKNCYFSDYEHTVTVIKFCSSKRPSGATNECRLATLSVAQTQSPSPCDAKMSSSFFVRAFAKACCSIKSSYLNFLDWIVCLWKHHWQWILEKKPRNFSKDFKETLEHTNTVIPTRCWDAGHLTTRMDSQQSDASMSK